MKTFKPKFFLKNAHVQTILPRLIDINAPKCTRVLYPDSTNSTQVAYDFIYSQDAAEKNIIYVLFHGLEGGSHSAYAKALMQYAKQHDKNFVIPHYRGCGGLLNLADKDYHAGDTEEILHVLRTLKEKYSTIYAIGVSLGGNMLAKYLGENTNTLCQKAAIICAPVDLKSAAKSMQKFVARYVYAPYLLKTLLLKAANKAKDAKMLEQLAHVKNLTQFDELYTAPKHGFLNAHDYYQKASSLPLLKNIKTPTLMLFAKDDPFMGIVAMQKDVSNDVTLLHSPYGGHVGFIDCKMIGHKSSFDLSYLSKTCFEFFSMSD